MSIKIRSRKFTLLGRSYVLKICIIYICSLALVDKVVLRHLFQSQQYPAYWVNFLLNAFDLKKCDYENLRPACFSRFLKLSQHACVPMPTAPHKPHQTSLGFGFSAPFHDFVVGWRSLMQLTWLKSWGYRLGLRIRSCMWAVQGSWVSGQGLCCPETAFGIFDCFWYEGRLLIPCFGQQSRNRLSPAGPTCCKRAEKEHSIWEMAMSDGTGGPPA